eukprot:TRINITY_DN3573_c0_g1_i1.p1 TRINITY_DN3573_c0_g1~~TRINITY_DN3573_c0_g1_i1.p1  ORF type:complete len:341 (-),score=81.33 TRINITY_DN3573_c0_g1_i1:159-1181(-)
MAYPSLENIDEAWLERTLAGTSISPSSVGSTNWSTFDSTTLPTVNRPSKDFYGVSKFQSITEPTILPPFLPASAFVDASSPEAWAPRPVNPTPPMPVKQQTPVKQAPVKQPLLPVVEDIAADAARSDIETELNKQNLYKTELCRNWLETGQCRYGARCQFAHGEYEMRDVMRHPKYKTEICRTFHTTGTCSYGKRCRFVHHSNEMRVNDGSEPAQAFNQQIGLLKTGGTTVATTPRGRSASLPRLCEHGCTSVAELPSPPMSPSRVGNTSTSPPPSPIKSFKLPEVVADVTETSEEDFPEDVSPVVNEANEEYQVSDQALKKSCAYRLPFFAKLHSWKKK